MSSKVKSQPRLKIPSPPEVSTVPDPDTKKSPTLMDGNVPEQVFHFKGLGVSYGTDDKAHAASLILSFLLGCLLLVLFAVGAFVERLWIPDAIKIVGTAFTLTAGVAIGKGSQKTK